MAVALIDSSGIGLRAAISVVISGLARFGRGVFPTKKEITLGAEYYYYSDPGNTGSIPGVRHANLCVGTRTPRSDWFRPFVGPSM